MNGVVSFHSTVIHLSLEDYYNAGMTPAEAKEIIESIPDVGSGHLWCETSGINGNWNARTLARGQEFLDYLAWQIELLLDNALSTKKIS